MSSLNNKLEEFDYLLRLSKATKVTEHVWQNFFDRNPVILAESLPCKFDNIYSQVKIEDGRADYFFHRLEEESPFFSTTGLIELKRPDQPILKVRGPMVKLADKASDAYSQTEGYLYDINEAGHFVKGKETIAIGNNKVVFIIIGLEEEIQRKITTKALIKKHNRVLPPGFGIFPYDTLFNIFTGKLPRPVFVFNGSTQGFTDRWVECFGFRIGVTKYETHIRNSYRLRYEVYCKEFGFLPIYDYQDRLEKDEYDQNAVHIVCIGREDWLVGTCRLILNSERGFPAEKVTKTNFIGQKPPAYKIAEVSRLAVAKSLRRKRGDKFYGIESYLPNQPEQDPIERHRPKAVMSLYQAVYHACKKRGITHLYILAEDKLYNVLFKFGFLFHKVGETVDYYGRRAPYLGIIEEMEHHMRKVNPALMEFMTAGLEDRYLPKVD